MMQKKVRLFTDCALAAVLATLVFGASGNAQDVGEVVDQEKFQQQTSEIEGQVEVDFDDSEGPAAVEEDLDCLLYTSPSPRDRTRSRMPSSA